MAIDLFSTNADDDRKSYALNQLLMQSIMYLSH